MTTPKISVLMSSFNDGKFIEESMLSILNQTFDDFEFILINDGSTDNTLSIIKRYAKLDKRIIVINNLKNLGFINSLNEGLKKVKGKYIARMDADDVALFNRFQIQFEYLEKNNDIFMVGSYLEIIDVHGKKIGLGKVPIKPEEIRKTLLDRCCMWHNSIMFRNERKLRYREKMFYVEDYDLYLRIISEGKKLANIPLPLVKYRRNPDSVSFSKKGKQTLFSQKAREFYFQKIEHGTDNYNSFNPKTILDVDIKKCIDRDVILSEIKVNFALNNLIETREYIIKYQKNFGLLNHPYLIFYLFATYTNKKLVKKIKQIIKFFIGKY